MKALSAVALSAALFGGWPASPARASTGEYLDDMAITARIEAELLDGEGIWSTDIIHVETVGGVVHLSGYATAEHGRQRAGEIAQSVTGVKQVNNDVRVR